MRHSYLNKLALGLVMGLALSACTVESEVTSDAPKNPFDGLPSNPGKEDTAATAYEGKWATDCVADEGNYGRMINQMEIKGNTIKVDAKFWFGTSCTGTPYFADTAEGTFVLNGKSPSSSEGAEMVDITLKFTKEPQPQTQYDIILKENDQIFMAGTSGDTAAKRPMKVYRNAPYKRQ